MAAATPFIRPLHDTRAVERTLAEIAEKMQVPYEGVSVREMIEPLAGELTVDDVLHQGGFWNDAEFGGVIGMLLSAIVAPFFIGWHWWGLMNAG